MAEEKSIEKVSQRLVKLASMEPGSLMVKENVDAICAVAKDVNDQMKVAKENDAKVKSEVKRLMAEHVAKPGSKATAYSWDSGMKLVVSRGASSAVIDETRLFEELCEHFGEDVSNKEGIAWSMFLRVTDPVEMPRKINPEKLAKVMSDSRAGIVDFPEDAVSKATEFKEGSVSATCRAVTKQEKQAHDRGEMTEVFVCGE